ncbi:MAG: tRNA uridine-5-carboxymethylaminomethyl(34) synthesis GTPase MnmE, partial [Candidatus Cloacimonetes bacterium]|nr:tRNA uridine-5-carboxymethylaminomethyl(34) synthesis GTPase MnmE [Candidatus Cloacimonadota bacterium]
IAAISTPPGTGGIHLIRVSGTNSIELVNRFFSGDLLSVKANSVTLGEFIHNDVTMDQVLVTVFKAPRSYTGEDVVEISCHGSQFIAEQILTALLTVMRLANHGEFTLRAFLNNKLDLTQAEAVNDLINSRTRKSREIALKQLEGTLFARIAELLDKLIQYRLQLELEIDFLDDDTPEIDMSQLRENLTSLKQELQTLAESGNNGRIIREGLKVCLIGAPNVGKSSIFNTFLETERAIVTPTPGTTRDYLEEVVAMQGYLVRFFDTAGIRETEDSIEKIGIQRSWEIIRQSDKVIYVSDGEQSKDDYSLYIQDIPEEKLIKVINKVDLLSPLELAVYTDFIPCSTVTPDGIKRFEEALLTELRTSENESVLLTNTRQISAVQNAVNSLNQAITSIDNQMGYEFTAFDLKEASQYLEEVIGRISADDLLNKIFDNFCIGK